MDADNVLTAVLAGLLGFGDTLAVRTRHPHRRRCDRGRGGVVIDARFRPIQQTAVAVCGLYVTHQDLDPTVRAVGGPTEPGTVAQHTGLGVPDPMAVAVVGSTTLGAVARCRAPLTGGHTLRTASLTTLALSWRDP